jgi:hypothetical protein
MRLSTIGDAQHHQHLGCTTSLFDESWLDSDMADSHAAKSITLRHSEGSQIPVIACEMVAGWGALVMLEKIEDHGTSVGYRCPI